MKNTGTLEVTTPTEREIVMMRVFDYPRRLVFDALTQPELLQRWFLGPPGWSLVVCEIDLRVGGAFRYVWRRADGREFGIGGVYREIVPPERIVHTELFEAGEGTSCDNVSAEEGSGGETLVTTVLREQGGKTTLTTTQLYASREVRDAMLRSGMEQGVIACYDRLAELLASTLARGG